MRHDEDLHFHVWARKLMNHSVAAKLAGLGCGPGEIMNDLHEKLT
jgi:hypothetical protein